jgi:hypothetical protein
MLVAATIAGSAGCPSEGRGVTSTATVADRERTEQAAALMMRFAERTGLTSGRSERRYLWTDAFAVCNFLGLARTTGDARYTELGLRLVDRVHHTLGKHRPDDPRTGWISGLSAEEGEAHPTRGGLRIGKDLPERRPEQPFDDRLEWERDGQYFHYLTQWMHALDQVTRSTGKPQFNVWGRELAEAAHRAFVYPVPGDRGRRMYWKMSIDGSRPLVGSMGQHDALDGYVACAELQATASTLPAPAAGPSVDDEASDFASMIDPLHLVTADPLGLGALLLDAYRVDQLVRRRALADAGLRDKLLRAALVGLEEYARGGDLRRDAEHRSRFGSLASRSGFRRSRRCGTRPVSLPSCGSSAATIGSAPSSWRSGSTPSIRGPRASSSTETSTR